jgi:hypothetical protein
MTRTGRTGGRFWPTSLGLVLLVIALGGGGFVLSAALATSATSSGMATSTSSTRSTTTGTSSTTPTTTGTTSTTPTTTGTTSTTTPTCRPNDLKLVAGSPQTTRVGSAFATNLQVTLANKSGCTLTGSLGGVSVTFTAPSSGASGTFASTGSNAATVGTDATGVASAPTFTANDSEGDYEVRAESRYGSVTFQLSNTATGVAASITAAGPTEQAATVNTQYAQPLQAKVVDAHGAGVKGVTVSFSLGTGPAGAGASFLGGGAQATARTDASGLATSPAVVANGTPGRFTATASAEGIPGAVAFSLGNHAANYTVKATSQTAQTATINSRYPAPLQVQVLDEAGQPIEGATVTFTVAAGPSGSTATFVGGEGAQTTALTDVSGKATSAMLVANGTPGRFTATATVPGGTSPVTYELRNLAGTLTAARPVLTATVNQPYRARLRARMLGAKGHPLDGITVTFTVAKAANGATAMFPDGTSQATATTNTTGWASSPALAANGTPGRFSATATVPGGTSPVTYVLRNLAGTLTAGRAVLTATVNERYRARLRARMLGAKGRPLDGITVTFTITKAANGATATFPDGTSQATATTNTAGWASSPALAANSTVGRFTASATIIGIGKYVGYRLRNLAGKPDSITAGAASGESTTVGSRFPIRLAVTVLDADDNSVVGAIVTFTAPARGPSGRFTIHPPNKPRSTRKSRVVRVKTNSDGIAVAPPLTANATPGGYVVTATVARSRQHTAFALINTPASSP